MATPPAPAGSAKSVDPSLWWDSFSITLTELENASLSSELTPNLAKKLKDNHSWFVETVSRFKSPNEKSREALDSSVIKVGSHQLNVKPELKDTALKISSLLSLDEVQAYIVVERSIEGNAASIGLVVDEILHLAMLQYYLERQCLLKCTKQIILNSLNEETPKEGNTMCKEANNLFSDGLERRLISILEDLLSSSLPQNMDIDIFSLWAEEILIEGNLVLDILFLSYQESFCSCDSKHWKELCLFYEGMICGTSNFGKLAISAEALQSYYHAKVQLLLILIKTLDLENLLRMIHDETPFRRGSNVFSLKDIQEMDAIISRFELKEAGPLILSWATFLCLISSLPGKQDYNMDIDHASYVRQAFDAASLNYILEILQTDLLKASDDRTAGLRSVMRTFISAFIASYEISLQLEDNTLKLILGILSNIYRGEESLCVQFWDRDSFIDGPVRCLLCNLEGEFPFRTLELVRLLSALSEGSWPAECVYNFLDKSVGISSLFEINNNSVIDRAANIVETNVPLCIPGIEGLLIPSNTRGHVLKLVDRSTALVRWEYAQSGVLVLLLRLAQEMYLDNSDEVLATLDLLSRLVSSSKAVCYNFLDGYTLCAGGMFRDGHEEKNVCRSFGCSFNVLEIICSLVKKIPPSCSGSSMMAKCVNILVQMLKCSPSHTSAVAVRTNIFDVALATNPFNIRSDGLSSGSWLLSGRLANMLLIDCEQNDDCCPLTLSVLDLTMQLVETGVENDVVLSLVVFSLQYILVNHGYWKYKVKHARWKVTLKVLELMKKCILICPSSQKLGDIVRDVLLCDSSIHNTLFQIVCMTEQTLEKLYVSRLYDLTEIEGLELAICATLDVLHCMLSDISQDVLPSLSVFHHAVLSPSTKPIPVLTAMMSLMSCFHSPAIQVGAAKLLSVLFVISDFSPPYAFGNACFGLDEKQITHLRNTINSILHEQLPSNKELFVAVFKLLTSAAHHQPAFLVALISSKENSDLQKCNVIDGKSQTEHTFGSVNSVDENLMVPVLNHIEQFNDLLNSEPGVLLSVLDFLNGLWQGAAQFINVLDRLRNSEKFWAQLSDLLLSTSNEDKIYENFSEKKVAGLAYRYQCQSAVLQLFAYETFLQKKLLHAELLVKHSSGLLKDRTESTDSKGRKKLLSTLHGGSVLPNLIKSYASCGYDNRIFLRAKIATALFSVHVMEKSKTGNMGSISVSLVEKIQVLMKKLSEMPAFSELSTQYTQRGYSEAKELDCLILNDLYYHLQGELEGREIDPGPFKELSRYLIETKCLQTYQHKFESDLFEHAKNLCLFDISRLRADLGLDWWEYSLWKASKPVVETLLLCLNNVNSMVLVENAKLSALKSLSTIYSMLEEDNPVEATVLDLKIPKQLTSSCIEEICHCLQACIEFLVPLPESSKDVLESITAQGELLVHLIRYAKTNLSLSECILVLKTSGSGLKVLSELRPTMAGVRDTMKLLLVLLLSSVESSYKTSDGLGGAVQGQSVEGLAEASSVCLRLLPILCNYIKSSDTCTLSLATIDLVLKDLLTPGTWVPIIQKNLPWQHLFPKLNDRSSINSVPVILKFLLTIARVREGAQMLLAAGFFSTLRVLFADLSDGGSSAIQSEIISSDESEIPSCTWGLGLAVVNAMFHSLGASPSTDDVVDYMINYFFSEKASLISYYINAPEFPTEGREKKRSRAQRTLTSLNALKETENTLLLICMLSNHRTSWMKAMKEVGTHLRERSIHYLAFISRATKPLGDTPVKTIPIFCHPLLKEEYEWYKKPSLVNSRSGWFALAPLGCGLNPRFSAVSSRANALAIKDQTETSADTASQTYFSDTVALQIYRIAFLNLKFLCLQAEGAVRRAEEMGFVDIARFPELPMPEILHGLQDQGIAVVSELCEGNRNKQTSSKVQGVCILLLQMTEMALYLEFCVSQICGIRPVSGHVEDFSKRMKTLLKAAEGHVFLNGSLKSLKHTISYAFPGLLQAEDL